MEEGKAETKAETGSERQAERRTTKITSPPLVIVCRKIDCIFFCSSVRLVAHVRTHVRI
jgi:hypothetical protein